MASCPGREHQDQFDEDNAWAYGMSVYVPSFTNAAATGVQARDAREPHRAANRRSRRKAASGTPSKNMQAVNKPGKEVKQGPTGKIEPEE